MDIVRAGTSPPRAARGIFVPSLLTRLLRTHAMAAPADHAAPPTAATAGFWQSPAFAVAAALVLAAALATAAGVSAAMHRPFWLDEIVTQLVANAPHGLLHAMRSGVDFQPPPHYLLVRWADALAGGASPAAARMPSVIAALLTVAVLVVSLRAAVSLAAALVGALALVAHPLFVAQAFEARPYALWILATALVAESLREGRAARVWWAAGASALLCSVHYFGVLSLAAIATAVVGYTLLARRASWRDAAQAAAPLGAGGLALLALLPLARAQLASTGGRSWVSPSTLGEIGGFLRFAWGWRPAAVLIVAGIVMLAARRFPAVARRLPTAPRITLNVTVVALLASALVPLLVVVVTLTYKPVLVLRYSAPAVLAVATLCALAVETLPVLLRWGAVLWLARAALFSLGSAASGARVETALLASEAQVVQTLAARGVPTVSPSRHDAYRTSELSSGTAGVAWLELSDSLLDRAAATGAGNLTRDFLLVERDFGRAVHREFGFPATRAVEQVRADSAVALLRDPALAGADSVWLPGRTPCPLSGRLVIFTRPPSVLPCGALRTALQVDPSRR